MSLLWEKEEQKLIKSRRKWEESPNNVPYRNAYLFCEKCGKRLGVFDIVFTNLETYKYCGECVKEFIRETPFYIDGNKILKDYGSSVEIRYVDNYYTEMIVNKICYFNKKGRYIKIKGKRYYLNKN